MVSRMYDKAKQKQRNMYDIKHCTAEAQNSYIFPGTRLVHALL